MSSLIIGVDPGPVPGVVGLLVTHHIIDNVDVLQVNYDLIGPVLRMLIRGTPHHDQLLVGVEKFVVSKRSGRSSAAGAGAITRDLVGHVQAVGVGLGAAVVQRPAVTVKGWATDERLDRAGIEIPKGMRHAKDAARHALYAACHASHLPDPLSSTYKKPRRP